MGVFTVLIIIILLVIVVSLTVGSSMYATRSYNLGPQMTMYPFAGYIGPDGSTSTLTNSDGNSQIQCPLGFNINIVGAFFDVQDPYGECGYGATADFANACGFGMNEDGTPMLGHSCNHDADCGGNLLTCPNGTCVFHTCNHDPDCSNVPGDANTPIVCAFMEGLTSNDVDNQSSNTNQNVCAYAQCNNLNVYQKSAGDAYEVTNLTCSPASTGNSPMGCMQRDATYYLSQVCNGQNSCVVSPTNTSFGPYPCAISPPANGESCVAAEGSGVAPVVINITDWKDTNKYCTLPFVVGLPGQNGALPSSYNMGYFVHGIYTCVPD